MFGNQWFKGGITNICYNCLDANIAAGDGEKIAIYWEGNELGVDSSLTYNQLLHNVCQVYFPFAPPPAFLQLTDQLLNIPLHFYADSLPIT